MIRKEISTGREDGCATRWITAEIAPIGECSATSNRAVIVATCQRGPAGKHPLAGNPAHGPCRNSDAGIGDLPEDLSYWVGHQTLADLSVLVARTVDESEFEMVSCSNQGTAWTERQLLVLLIYCYTIGLYDSQTIEEQIREDYRCGALLANDSPDSLRLRRYRRMHRSLLQQCLEDVFRSIYWYHARHCQDAEVTSQHRHGVLSCPLPDLSLELRTRLTTDVDRRLVWAARQDSMTSDDWGVDAP